MFPNLTSLLMSGRIMVEHMQYVGLASDNTLCVLPGSTDRPDQTEEYLRDFPAPESW